MSPSKSELAFLQVCLDIAEERYDQAIDRATSAIPAAEHPEEFYKLRGDAHAIRAMEGGAPQAKAADLGLSVEDFSEAIRLRANYAEAYRWRGAAQWLLGRADESMADFQAVLRMNPVDSLALGDMGTAYHKANKDDLAKKIRRRGMKVVICCNPTRKRNRRRLDRKLYRRRYRVECITNLFGLRFVLSNGFSPRIMAGAPLIQSNTWAYSPGSGMVSGADECAVVGFVCGWLAAEDV